MLNHLKYQPTNANPSVLVPVAQIVKVTPINLEYFLSQKNLLRFSNIKSVDQVSLEYCTGYFINNI